MYEDKIMQNLTITMNVEKIKQFSQYISKSTDILPEMSRNFSKVFETSKKFSVRNSELNLECNGK